MPPTTAPGSAVTPPAPVTGGVPSAPAGRPGTPLVAVAFVALFGVLMASFPARNLDLWGHLADGRFLFRASGGFDGSWLYNGAAYAIYSALGGVGLATAKALLCGVVAVLMFRLGRARGGWRVALVVTGLAVLAMGTRLLLQPATVALLFLATALWLLVREELDPEPTELGPWPGWRWVALFVLWANVDTHVVIGLVVVALARLGRLADAPQPGGVVREFGRRAAWIAVLAAAACASPSHVRALNVPPELRGGVAALREGAGAESPVNSPFEKDYLAAFRDSPAALSYYPLLALGLLSFLLSRGGRRWSWFLPWLCLAAASAVQVRLVPFFAVVAGPVTAWNLHEYFARRAAPLRPRLWYAAAGFGILLAAAFLVAAWPGWLQGPPFEPRRWAVEVPVALPWGADFLRRADASGLWPADTRTLHTSAETAAALAWFCPSDRGLYDAGGVGLLLTGENPEVGRQWLRERGVSRVVVYAGDQSPASREALGRLLLEPREWPVLHLTGGLVVFGWRDPARTSADPFAGWEVDFARLGFRPDESEVAPAARTPRDSHWWDAFWKPAPPLRPPGRGEARVLFAKSRAAARAAPLGHQRAWEAAQSAGLVGGAAGWLGPHARFDAGLRLYLLRPPGAEGAPLPGGTQLVLALYQGFAFERGNDPAGTLYAAIRAARRAVAENPGDSASYLLLGTAYAALANTTAEQAWTAQFPQLRRLRQLQASAALNRAVAINPRLAQAHLQLARLYLSLQLFDLAVAHLRTYRETPARWGGPQPGTPQAEETAAELERWTKLLDRETAEYLRESAKASVADRAIMAVQRGLGGQALGLLLQSDVAAFGTAGTEMQLNLLLQTGRPDDVLESTRATPELRGSLGDFFYHSLRAQALIAVGDYDKADAELAEMVGPGGRLAPDVEVLVGGLVGKALLDAQPGGQAATQFPARLFGIVYFEDRVADISQRLARSADVMVLRGLVALEAGYIDRARDAFRGALAYSPNRWGGAQLEFPSRRIAWRCLEMIDGPTDFLPARRPGP